MKKIITPRIFRSVFNLAIYHIIMRGLLDRLDFVNLNIQDDFFTKEDFINIRNLYDLVLTELRYKDIDNS